MCRTLEETLSLLPLLYVYFFTYCLLNWTFWYFVCFVGVNWPISPSIVGSFGFFGSSISRGLYIPIRPYLIQGLAHTLSGHILSRPRDRVHSSQQLDSFCTSPRSHTCAVQLTYAGVCAHTSTISADRLVASLPRCFSACSVSRHGAHVGVFLDNI